MSLALLMTYGVRAISWLNVAYKILASIISESQIILCVLMDCTDDAHVSFFHHVFASPDICVGRHVVFKNSAGMLALQELLLLLSFWISIPKASDIIGVS
uniref:Uncharacterized protein n=1 Tax=Megaselia scalaris TaxID=36166 RepID=T1GW05_MEGSC